MPTMPWQKKPATAPRDMQFVEDVEDVRHQGTPRTAASLTSAGGTKEVPSTRSPSATADDVTDSVPKKANATSKPRSGANAAAPSAMLPMLGICIASFAFGGCLAAWAVSSSKNEVLAKQAREIAPLRQRLSMLEDYVRQAAEMEAPSFLRSLNSPRADAATADESTMPSSADVTGTAGVLMPVAGTIASTTAAQGDSSIVVGRINTLAGPQAAPLPEPPSPRIDRPASSDSRSAVEREREKDAERERQIALRREEQRTKEALAASAKPASQAAKAATLPPAAKQAAQASPPEGSTSVAGGAGAQGAAVGTANSAATSALAANKPPSADPSSRIEAVAASKAGVARLEPGAVIMNTGRRVQIGERFESGETLRAVDPDKGKVVTNERTLMLL